VEGAVVAGDVGLEAGEGLALGFGAPGDELAVVAGAGGAARGEEVDGFEEVGLALSIVAEEEEAAGREGEVEVGVGAEAGELEASDVQARALGD
jgi:hypothetical protein